MKIKSDKLTINKNGILFEFSELELTITPKEIKEMEDDGYTLNKPQSIERSPIKLYYKNSSATEIQVGDFVDILPSEDCVTNADKIKYDERISSIKGLIVVISMSVSKNQVTVFDGNCTFDVHPHWLRFISRKMQ